MTASLAAFVTIDGLSWDPFMRGVTAVAIIVVVLMGSVYLLLATNSGPRTGMMLALAGFFGWMFIMGIVWWIYGIGLVGESPTWQVVEYNRGDLTRAQTEEVRDLAEAGDAVEDGTACEGGETSVDLHGWTCLPASDPARGEAQATVDAFLTGDLAEFGGTGEYVPLEAFEIGGKQQRVDDSMVERVANRLYSIFAEPTHPTHYAIIQVRAATPESLITLPGQAPPPPEPDENQPVLSVIMVRDLGSLRLPPALVTIGSLILFIVFAWSLHSRDLREKKIREDFASSVKG
ncbi:MAG: hypothetical protein S0880_11090 [Actinomycetota bacterium]|nr:hypothetical protein [Actinomycetota bacterium]